MKLAFYKASRGNIYDKSIDWWTGKIGYSHVEIVFEDGMCFSASPRENLVRFKKIVLGDKWEIIDLPICPKKEREIRIKAEYLQGSKYDWTGIFLHEFLPLNIDMKDKWWCSEIVAYLLELKDFKIDPNTLYLKMRTEYPFGICFGCC